MEIVAELFELVVVKLFVVVRYDGVGYPVPTDDILIHELYDFCRCDGCKCLGFDPLGEVVNNYHYILHATPSFRKLVD